MTPLSDELQAFLDAERDIDVPAPAERKRMFERLEPLLLVVPVALATASASTASAGAATAVDAAGSAVLDGALKIKIAAAVVSAALFGGAVGATGHAYLAPPPLPPSRVASVAPVASQLPETLRPAEDEHAAPALAPPTPSTGVARLERPRPAGSLRAERLLIETASAALLRGDHRAAIAALRQHARQFPKGDLAEEREVLLVRALGASGDGAAAQKRAEDFPKKFPNSLQRPATDDTARSP